MEQILDYKLAESRLSAKEFSSRPTAVNKSTNPRTRHRETPHEKLMLELYNADLRGNFPEINPKAPCLRVPLVYAAMAATAGRFELCRQTVQITRAMHNSIVDLVPATINKSLGMLARSKKKPAAKA
jgi:hypothetical protein